MVLIEPSDLGVANLKLLLLSFEKMAGLRINFAKSEVTVVGTTDHVKTPLANLLNCKLGKFPIYYPWLPMSTHQLWVSDWNFLTGKVGHRVDPWQGLFLASGGRLELTKSCLSSFPMFCRSGTVS
jgi:hypothetical protein